MLTDFIGHVSYLVFAVDGLPRDPQRRRLTIFDFLFLRPGIQRLLEGTF